MFRNNYASAEDSITRMQQLMGNTKPVTHVQEQALGTIEKVYKGHDGNAYAIVKENSHYFLKKSSKDKDLSLNDFEYLGGNRRCKNLYEYSSYNHAEKVLKEELLSIKQNMEKRGMLQEESIRVDNNLQETVSSKSMRAEIDRIRQIMENVDRINTTGSSSVIVENKKRRVNEKVNISDTKNGVITDGKDENLNEIAPAVIPLAVTAASMIPDAVKGVKKLMDKKKEGEGDEKDAETTGETIDESDISLDEPYDESGEEPSEGEDINLDEPEPDGELGDEESLDGEYGDEEYSDEYGDEEGSQEMEMLQQLMNKLDGVEDKIDNIGGIGETKRYVQKLVKETINTVASDITKDKFGYENVEPDGDGRTTFEDINAEEEVGLDSYHQDTLDDVKSNTKKGACDVKEIEIELVDESVDSSINESGDNIDEGLFGGLLGSVFFPRLQGARQSNRMENLEERLYKLEKNAGITAGHDGSGVFNGLIGGFIGNQISNVGQGVNQMTRLNKIEERIKNLEAYVNKGSASVAESRQINEFIGNLLGGANTLGGLFGGGESGSGGILGNVVRDVVGKPNSTVAKLGVHAQNANQSRRLDDFENRVDQLEAQINNVQESVEIISELINEGLFGDNQQQQQGLTPTQQQLRQTIQGLPPEKQMQLKQGLQQLPQRIKKSYAMQTVRNRLSTPEGAKQFVSNLDQDKLQKLASAFSDPTTAKQMETAFGSYAVNNLRLAVSGGGVQESKNNGTYLIVEEDGTVIGKINKDMVAPVSKKNVGNPKNSIPKKASKPFTETKKK